MQARPAFLILFAGTRALLLSARQAASHGADLLQVQTGYEIERWMVGHDPGPAEYGVKLVKELSYRLRAGFGLLLISLCGCSTVVQPIASSIPPTPTTSSPSIWVGSWGDSMTDAALGGDNAGGVDRSFRFLVTSTIDGSQARVKFSNVYGTTPVTIGAARLAIGQDGTAAVDPSRNVALSFGGNSSITMAPGTTITSDAVSITFGAGQVLAVSMYLKGAFGAISRHDSNFITNYTTANAAGDNTADITGNSFTATLGDWLLVNEVDVYGPYQGTLAMFGSSTTDGFKSNYGDTNTYPTPNTPVAGQHADRVSDQMSRRLLALGYRIGVINAGLPGDTVTEAGLSSPSANARIARDVLTLPNLLAMIAYFGSIDLRSSECKSAPEMEKATQQMVATAHAAGVPIVMATLPPSAFCTNPVQPNYGPAPTAANPYAGGLVPGPSNGAELQRAAFNAWIRSTGAALPGVTAIADYDLALRDPQNVSFMLPQYNSGDNQHMNGNGYYAEAQTVPLVTLPRP